MTEISVTCGTYRPRNLKHYFCTMVTISITPSDIKQMVDVRSAYIGVKAAKADGQRDYGHVATTSMDIAFFNIAYNEAAANVCTVLRRYSPDFVATGISLNMPNNYDTKLNDAVQKAIVAYIANYILYKWLTMVLPQTAEEYMNTAQTELASARTMLTTRLAPKRTAPTALTDTKTVYFE